MSGAGQTVSGTIESQFQDRFPNSRRLAEQARTLFPSGVTHDGRWLEPFPIYVDHASGSRKVDVDGTEIVDYWAGHGALLLGHSHPDVVAAVQQQAAKATHPGACHALEIAWGELVRELVPSCERLRFTSSGTEATLMALRLARMFSGRTKVIKFAGCFHGWHDLLSPASAPPHETGDYSLPGVTDGIAGDVVIVPPNDLAAVARAIEEHEPACVFLEGNGPRWGTVPVRPPFVQELRELTRSRDVLLVLDEVITGFRVAPGGFQSICGIQPDLTTMAKVLAGGLPGGCLGGRADVMSLLEFDNPRGIKMKHPGTYNANPLSAAAGIAALSVIRDGSACEQASSTAAEIRSRLNELFARRNVNWVAYGDYSVVKIHPEYDGPRPDSADFIPWNGDWKKLDRTFDRRLSHAFRCALLLGGVDWMGWNGNLTAAHSAADIEQTVLAFDQALDLLRADGLVD